MKRLAFAALLLLTSCIPSYRDATPRELSLHYDGAVLVLEAPTAPLRVFVGLRAEGAVTSPYCVNACEANADGVVLLRLAEGLDYQTTLPLGIVTGLKRARAVVVFPAAKEALVTEWTP